MESEILNSEAVRVGDGDTGKITNRAKGSKWKRLLGYGVGCLTILIAGFAFVVSLQSPNFSISRSTTISASPKLVFPHVNDLRQWEDWSPWAKIDPDMKETFEGPEAGLGAVHTWTGNDEVGEGRMTIVESQTDERVGIRLEFFRPFEASNDVVFAFVPKGDQTEIIWTMTGQNNFLCKAIHLILDMDKMLGAQFEQGLSSLKKVVETSTTKVGESQNPK